MFKKKFLVFILLASVVNFSCKQKEHHTEETISVKDTAPQFQTGIIYSHVSNAGLSYSVYIPSSFSGTQKFNTIIFFDPHGDGNVPLNKYKELAQRFSFVLIGCNDSKNGMQIDQSVAIADQLKKEVVSTLPVKENKISICGFSGGAKVALVSANSIAGFQSVIYCGAALPVSFNNINCPSLGFAGEQDMNFSDVSEFYSGLNSSTVKHALYQWKGKHEWPDTSSFIHTFYWSSLLPASNETPIDSALIKSFTNSIDVLLKTENNPVRKEYLIEEAIALTDDNPDYYKKLNELKKSPAFENSQNDLKVILRGEKQNKEMFASAFETKDMTWWKGNIDHLMENKNNMVDQRLLGYISLAAYSYSNQSIQNNNYSLAYKSLEIYKLADPENSEQPFLKATLYAKNGMPDSAVIFLSEAVKLGLKDHSKIDNDKNLSTLHGCDNFQKLMNSF